MNVASEAAAAAVAQVFGCVWLHHLVLIAASSKNWQDFQQTPSFLYSGVKRRHQSSVANSQVYLNISQPEGWERNNTSYESKFIISISIHKPSESGNPNANL